MAGTGPAPKPDGQRRRTNAPTHGSERVLKDDGERRGPDLAGLAPLPEDEDVRNDVLAWWDDWRYAPQAQTFLATDWRRLGMVSMLVAQLYAGDTKALAEIRLNEERLGATVADRLKVRIRVEPAETAPVVTLASAEDRFADRMGDE